MFVLQFTFVEPVPDINFFLSETKLSQSQDQSLCQRLGKEKKSKTNMKFKHTF